MSDTLAGDGIRARQGGGAGARLAADCAGDANTTVARPCYPSQPRLLVES